MEHETWWQPTLRLKEAESSAIPAERRAELLAALVELLSDAARNVMTEGKEVKGEVVEAEG